MACDISAKALTDTTGYPRLWYLFYLLAKQHIRPVFPRNQRNPMKRMSESTAVAYRRNLKKFAVRSDAES